MVALTPKENRAAQKRWRERHAKKRDAVQRISKTLLREKITAADVEELARALRKRLDGRAVALLRRALKPVTIRALCLILALVALVPHARAQPLPPDPACSEIVKTLDRITGHRDSNHEAVRRGFIACRLFPTRSSPPPSGNVMDEIQPNPRGITRSEVEQAVAEWCQTHTDAPLCKKLERER